VRQPRPNRNMMFNPAAFRIGRARGSKLHDHRQTSATTLMDQPAHAEGDRLRPVPENARRNARANSGRASIATRRSRAEAGPVRPEPAPEQASASEAELKFRADLIALIPNLRAFGITLAGRKDGEDLAQETLAKAWQKRASYETGTNLKAWAFTILRNHFYSGKRRDWRTQPLDPGVAETVLVAHEDPAAREELLDVRNAMQLLPDDQREALILAGPAGLSYDETARICGCAIGTVKSRVSRARASLSLLLEQMQAGRRQTSDISSGQAFENIMQQATDLQHRAQPSLIAE
jgi:RNA polymerase sigma-70 factor, ECF subfamily